MNDSVILKATQKEHYSLYDLWLHSRKGEPAYPILWAWYEGKIGELSAINKLRTLGLVKHDNFVEIQIKSDMLHKTVMQAKSTGWIKK